MAVKTWASGDVLTASDMNTYPLQKGVATTKGDLLVATTDSTVTRLGVGTNGYVLMADSTQSAGIKWAANTPGGATIGSNGYMLLADSNQTAGVRYSGPAAEAINVVASAATGTINVNLDTAPIWYYTTNASANHTLNIRYSATVSLNTYLATGSSCTAVWLNTNGATPYYPNVIQIDGSTVTPKWISGAAPTGGSASAVDSYVFTIIKTGSAAFTVLASQTKYA